MKKSWNEKWFGHVTVIIKGRLIEPFLNQAVREGIEIWDVKRINEQKIECAIMLRDVKALKPLLKKTECRVHFKDRYGLPFVLQRLMSRSGIVIGILLAFAIIFILSNMVWAININGADPKVEQEIQSILKKKHIHVGSLEFLLPSLNSIETELSSQLNKVTWVGVSKHGTTYRIDVVQKELPKKEKETGPRDLVATKEGTIQRVYVEKGQSMVEPDQVVQKGDTLVSGTIGKTEDPGFVSAKGKVIAETWYHSTTEVPLDTSYQTYTGSTYTKHQLTLFGWDAPLWGLKSKPFDKYKKEVNRKKLHFLFWDLPISYKKTEYREYDKTSRPLTETEALTIGKTDAKNHLLAGLPEGSKVINEKVRTKRIKDGKLMLTIFFTVHEDIAEPRSFLPKERKKEIEKKNEEEEESQ
ncbi:hypothetical protein JOD43_003223 [Pullulanibacillus pueri]|uniref:Sporulation protein YqfD n=1 Tax=Pullulanibacillus pueri TaxID=1437324 RepID=A0A8J3EMK4_9BACL|nr:sporulation protein YqfD [Pullulanibacillus pueri]MBM7683044.1 hypothetical protein [Pullulanibacillus pueri]GGH84974.1 sporulation protein YqfD [Pullulanibacillus pueri]